MNAKSLKSCLTLCDPVDRSLQGSSVHGILQAMILEWVAMLSSIGCIPSHYIHYHPFSPLSPNSYFISLASCRESEIPFKYT